MFDAFDSFTLFDWSPGFGVGRRGRKLLRRGEPATARIAGISVSRTGSDGGSNENHYAYALDIPQPLGAPERLACRQNLRPSRKVVGLGDEVLVRYRGHQVIIDWAATLDRLGIAHEGRADSPESWKPLRRAPASGVEDREQNGARRRIARGRPARATVVRISAVQTMFGTAENVDVDVLLTFDGDKTQEGIVRKVIPPDYAAKLLTIGSVLPVGVEPDGRVTVDWIAAANSGASSAPGMPADDRRGGSAGAG